MSDGGKERGKGKDRRQRGGEETGETEETRKWRKKVREERKGTREVVRRKRRKAIAATPYLH